MPRGISHLEAPERRLRAKLAANRRHGNEELAEAAAAALAALTAHRLAEKAAADARVAKLAEGVS